MGPKPIGDPAVIEAMEEYRKTFGKEFPIDWIDRDFTNPEEAVVYISSFIISGKPVTEKDLVDTEAVYGERFDLSEYL
jgi:hypothetical protein